jgi:hypothetical protein
MIDINSNNQSAYQIELERKERNIGVKNRCFRFVPYF